MVYIRRYLSGQQATTVTIAQGAITSDKIVDGAVTHPKLAPGSVDSERVINESLKSEDIKDGEIKSQDIASGAVTTDKIASQAVTVDKLEASIQGIARPLTPGVDTAEIQDAKVTLAKLAPNSVNADKIVGGSVGPSELAVAACEESRIKDGACTRDKIAVGAIDSTKLGVGSCDGSAILNGSVGSTELATDSVITEKIKNNNVTTEKINPAAVNASRLAPNACTEPKLDGAALGLRHLISFDARVDRHYDQFKGENVSRKWRKRVDAGGSVFYSTTSNYAGMGLNTDNTNGAKVILDWEEHGTHPAWGDLSILFKVLPTDRDYQTRELGLAAAFDKANYALFTAEDLAGGIPNWFARCKGLGGETVEDTGVAVSASPQILEIEYEAGGAWKFYIDGFLVNTIATHSPSIYNLDPWMSIIARSNAARGLWIETMSLIQERA